MPSAMGEADKSVIEIQVTDHNAVGKSRQIGGGLDTVAQDLCSPLCIDIARELDGDLTRPCSIAAERAAERVEDSAFGDANDVIRQVFVFEVVCISNKRIG